MVPSFEQKKVFKRAAQGCRKIVLSTNMAETAITIDDVVYVIDTGRMLFMVSKANTKQREGQASRCQPGICYHLYSKLREASLPEFQEPEIKRMPSRRNGAAGLYVMRNGAANLRDRPSHSVGHMLIRLPRPHARSFLRLIQLRGRSVGMAPGK